MTDVLEEPYLLEITSVTWGTGDFTALARVKYAQYQSENPTSKSFPITASNTWFQNDPDPTIWKACVVVWRNTIPLPDGEIVWSDFKKVAFVENTSSAIKFDGVGDTSSSAPGPGRGGRFVFSAFWWTQDCTYYAQQICNIQPPDPTYQAGPKFNISLLGPDPQSANPSKQFSLTYGDWVYPGRWSFKCMVQKGPSSGWTMTLPLLFPPLHSPSVYDYNNYITFRNQDISTSLYPQIYGLDGSLAWDGKANGVLIPQGGSRDIDLIAQAGLVERQKYYCGFMTADGKNLYGACDSYVNATSSAMARPCGLNCHQTIQGPLCQWDYINYSRPFSSYQPADLRLNIYSATYGNAEYTDFVRQAYISNTINNPPTNTTNAWSLTATSTPYKSDGWFGPDPNYGVGKTAVVIYRVAYCIGKTDGIINGPNDPPPWDPLYTSQKIQSLHINQYPVLRDITGFRIAAAQEPGRITFNLLTESLSAWTPPSPSSSRFIAAAVWSNRDVTPWVSSAVTQASSNADASVSVGPNTMGQGSNPADPWPGCQKQVTVLVGYPADQKNDPTTWQWRTIIGWNAASQWTLTIPARMPNLNTQLPVSFTSDTKGRPAYRFVWLANQTNFDVWPLVCTDAGQVVWDGKSKDANKYKIQALRALLAANVAGSQQLDLFNDVKCTEGGSYSINFNTGQKTYPPFSGWISASSLDAWKCYLTYKPAAVGNGQFDILKEIVYGG